MGLEQGDTAGNHGFAWYMLMTYLCSLEVNQSLMMLQKP